MKSPQEVETLLGLLGDGAGVDGPHEVLLDVNTKGLSLCMHLPSSFPLINPTISSAKLMTMWFESWVSSVDHRGN